MSSYCSVICVDTLDDSKFIKPAQKKKNVAGKQCSVCAGCRWLKIQLQWGQSIFLPFIDCIIFISGNHRFIFLIHR